MQKRIRLSSEHDTATAADSLRDNGAARLVKEISKWSRHQRLYLRKTEFTFRVGSRLTRYPG